jgi:hypothetical protein
VAVNATSGSTRAAKQSAPLDELFAGLTASPVAPGGSSSSLLGGLPQPVLQQQQQQQQQRRPAPAMQPQPADLLGSDLGLTGPRMQQPAAPFGGLQQPNGAQQVQQLLYAQTQAHQQPHAQQPQPAQHMPYAAGGGSFVGVGGTGGVGSGGSSTGGGVQLHGASSTGGSGSVSGLHKTGSSAAAWAGHDDVSNLMRQVAHGGKYDPAFDFVTDELKRSKRR